jgi:hypothetical protein
MSDSTQGAHATADNYQEVSNVNRYFLCLSMLAALVASVPMPARAAESYDNCTGNITTLPATISTQGTWCLKQDVSTAITSGVAITIATNNVILDCNDFKVGGLAAGVGTNTIGIQAVSRVNAIVRNCSVRGFQTGIQLIGDGHLIEDNRVEQSTAIGISVFGEGGIVRRNRVVDTGGRPSSGESTGISLGGGSVSVTDNIINGLTATGSNDFGFVYGINLASGPSDVSRNFVSNLVPSGDGTAKGIWGTSTAPSNLHGNTVMNMVTVAGQGIDGGANSACSGNTVSHFATPVSNCTVTLDNLNF